ncbi:CybS-domain-containing protein [Dioszegia hungarica]|uniref:Succinate dehydrogenase [ubiquinone] cytochrome b small subunit n=1 Tax=Dioszegia hungarica TaxID=4972 RepID=A0AA38HBY5_9TREE|nr:CybS-domain-containing protein [Dioszegia hungarica]KAI9638507.1 CybS-domain-containing protein [Dioszegia hungarica]
MSTSALFRPTTSALRAGLGFRGIHSSRVLAVQASRPRLDATIDANETAGFKYTPGGPILKGTVNDATSFPAPNAAHGSYHWAFERVLSASLIPVMGAAAVSTGSAYPIIDGVLAVSLIIHSHIGFDSIVVDYLHPRKFPVIGPMATWALRGLTGLAVWGVYEFNTNDVGLTELVARLWRA